MFDLNAASAQPTGKKYQEVGIYDNVKISGVELNKTTVNQVPYLRLLTEGENGEIGSSAKLFLSTTAKNENSQSAWSVTARNLVNLIKATHNVDEDKAKAMIDPSKLKNEEDLRNKVQNLLVGRPFRAKFKGETSQKGYVFAVLAQPESMKITETKMKFDPAKDIKAFTPFAGQNTLEANVVPVSDTDENPF
jgi:hypothetical protein